MSNHSEIYALMAKSSGLRTEWTKLDAELRVMEELGWEGLPNEAELDDRFKRGKARLDELEQQIEAAGAEFRAALGSEFEPNTPFQEPKNQSQRDYVNLYAAAHLWMPKTGGEA